MKSIQLKDYSSGNFKSTTKTILAQVIDYSGANAITTSEQRKRIKLLDMLEDKYQQNETSIEIEDADYNYIITLIDGMKWSVSNDIIRDFVKDFS